VSLAPNVKMIKYALRALMISSYLICFLKIIVWLLALILITLIRLLDHVITVILLALHVDLIKYAIHAKKAFYFTRKIKNASVNALRAFMNMMHQLFAQNAQVFVKVANLMRTNVSPAIRACF